MRAILGVLVAALTIGLAACGGGGGSDSTASSSSSTTSSSTTSSSTTSSSTSTSTLATDASATPTSSSATNTVPITISSAPYGNKNRPMVSVTICAPGSNAASSCSTIDNVLLDTGSYGLRLYASVVPSTTLSTLTTQTQSSTSDTIAECAIFGSGYTWGTVRRADIKMSSEIAENVPIHIMTDSSLTESAPTDCQVSTALSTPALLGANGILGVGVRPQDCGSSCVSGSQSAAYYACDSSTCTATTEALASQVGNPVQYFTTDNNGVIVEISQVADTGASTVSGTLVFGIDTETNNVLSGTSATVFTTDAYGDVTATFNGTTYTDNAFFDTGSNGLFFADSGISQNSSTWYTPSSTLGLSATVTGSNSSSASIGFNIANATTLFATGNYAFNDLGAYLSGSFDFGLPFFYGRHVYFGITGTSSSGGGSGPYVSYVSS